MMVIEGIRLGFLLVTLVAALAGNAAIAAMAMFPVALLLVALFFTSIYFTFQDSFADTTTDVTPA